MAGLPPLKVELVANAGPFIKALAQANDVVEKLAKALTLLAEGGDKAFASLDRMAAPLTAIADKAEVAKKATQGLSRAQNALAKASDRAATATDGAMTTISAASERMAAAVDTSTTAAKVGIKGLGEESLLASRAVKASGRESLAAGAGMRTAAKDAEAFGEKAKASGLKALGLEAVFKELATWGPLSLGAIVVESARMATKFQAAMTQINTQAGVSKGQLAGLSSGVLSLAGQVGFSPDSLAEALFHVESSFASTGITGKRALDILKVAAEGAAVGHANLVDVQNALDAAIASGIPGVQNYQQAMGQLNAIVGAGDMQMQDLANALGTGVLAVVKGYGLTLNDVGAALATFGDNNIRGAVAATDLRMAVQSLAVPTKDGIGLLKKWGLSADSLSKDMQQHGLVYTLNQLHDLFVKNGVTANQQGQVITDMFGKKAGAGLAVLMGQLDRVNSKVPDLAKGASGFAGAWQTAQHTLSQQLNQMKAGFDSVMIKIGSGLIPMLSSLITLVETKGAPAFHAIGSAVGGLFSGFTGSAQKKQKAGGPDLSPWQKAGKEIRSIFGDIGKTVGEIVKIFGNLWTAVAPVAAVIGVTLLGALKGVSAFLADYLGPALVAVSGFLAKNKGIVDALVIALLAWKVAAAAAAVQTAILDAAADANPIGLLVIAIAALVGGLIMLWQHSQTARVIMTEAFSIIGIGILELVKNGLQAIKFFVDIFIGNIGALIHTAAILFGWVPGLGGKLKNAAKEFDGFVRSVDGGLNTAINTVGQWQKNLVGLPTQVKIQGNIDDLTKKIDAAKAQLSDKNLPPSKKLTLIADIRNWQQQVLKAKLALAQTPDKKRAVLTAQITDWTNQINQATKQLKNAPASKKAVLTAEIQALLSNVSTAKAALASIPDRTVTVTYQAVNHQAVSTTGFTYARGGIHIPGVRAAAAGLMTRQAGFANKPILWAEAGPEAYIPLSPGKRTRSRKIAAETVGILGGHVSWDGGRSLAMTTPSSGGAVAPAESSSGGAAGGQLPPIIVKVGSKTLFEILQTEATRYNRRNPTNGLTVTTR